MELLVDTGAASTSLNPHEFNRVGDIYSRGERKKFAGIGGAWPCRRFSNVAMTFALDDGEAVTLVAPSIDIPAPYVRESGGVRKEATAPTQPSRKGLISNMKYRAPALLGRNFFRINSLQLFWDPTGDAYIEVQVNFVEPRR